MNSTWGYDLRALVRCDLQPEGLAKWQLETYEKIMSAYFELKSLYDSQIAAARARQGAMIQGRNPIENREIERNELKRNIIEMLEQQHFDQPPLRDDAIREVAPQNYPEVNFSVARAERDFIQWFEQAFEWPQMTYVCYPYYWNKKDDWPQELTRSDTDPLFAAFMKAGAARVQVPVRPGFENAAALYLATGIIWNGQQVPSIGDPLYVSLIQELQSQQDAEFEGTPEGNPWPVRLPTTLVILQEDGVLQP
jgi:hypothetical protein